MIRFPSIATLLVLATVPCVASLTVSSLDGSVEFLGTGDTSLLSNQIRGSASLGNSEILRLRLGLDSRIVDYQPNSANDPFGYPIRLKDRQKSVLAAWEHLSGRNQFRLEGSAYDGFRNHTAMWIDEYYRQQYSSGGIPGVSYKDPDPAGYGLVGSWRREVTPGSDFLGFSLGYLVDRVAPGYEIEDLGNSFELVRGDTLLRTWTGSVDWESIPGRRARMRHSLRLTSTTGREIRFSWNGSLHCLVSTRWISRTTASWSKENPNFESWSVSQTFEYAFPGNWAVALTGRIYSDTGQIESANLVSSAAPKLDSRQLFLTIRNTSPDGLKAISFSIGPYWSDYGETGLGTARFKELYRDRDWWWGRIAFHREI